MERVLIRHVQERLGLYLLVGFCFLAGVAGGALLAWAIKPHQQSLLAGYLSAALESFNASPPDARAALQQSLTAGLQEIGILWFLGLTVIGIPLIAGYVLFKGLCLGFAVGFLVQERALQGLAIALLSILPPSVIAVPALLMAAVLAISFSRELIRGRRALEGGSIAASFSAYTILMALVGVALVTGGVLESYLAPAMIKVVLNYLA